MANYSYLLGSSWVAVPQKPCVRKKQTTSEAQRALYCPTSNIRTSPLSAPRWPRIAGNTWEMFSRRSVLVDTLCSPMSMLSMCGGASQKHAKTTNYPFTSFFHEDPLKTKRNLQTTKIRESMKRESLGRSHSKKSTELPSWAANIGAPRSRYGSSPATQSWRTGLGKNWAKNGLLHWFCMMFHDFTGFWMTLHCFFIPTLTWL